MTVPAELAREGQRFEYFVAIEGIGWPTNGLSGALSGGFSGRVWSTNDMSANLATVLGCTVATGLMVPDSISESFDPRTCSYSPPGLSFKIIDDDDWWLANLTPRKSETYTELFDDGSGVGLHPRDRRVTVNDGTALSQNDLVWIGGRELVKLGPKIEIAAPVYKFYPSIRGYLGTQTGSSLRRPEDYALSYWPVGTSVGVVARWWWNRRVTLWAHVPGEAVENCELIWVGRLRDVTNPNSGLEWELSCVGDQMNIISRVHRAVDWRCYGSYWISRTYLGQVALTSDEAAWNSRRVFRFMRPADAKFGADGGGLYELATAYHYRCEPGGTAGMVAAFDTGIAAAGGSPQALDIDSEVDVLRSFVMVEDAIYYMYHRTTRDGETHAHIVDADVIPYAGSNPMAQAAMSPSGSVAPVELPSYADGARARFLLSNYGRDRGTNRFCVNGNVTRNVVDTALIFMLSSDREYYKHDTVAGSTSTVIQFGVGASGADADQWIGKALFCMEGTYKWQAREIVDNDADSITVSPGFSGAPPAGVEMQVRNSIYDVLPLGWGLGVPSEEVDIDSFERMRDEHLRDCNVGEFIIGTEDETDIWKMISENIFKPYGILVYFDFTTRKTTARYIGTLANDGAFESFTSIVAGDILRPGDIRHTFSNPMGTMKLKVRACEERIVDTTNETSVVGVVGTGTIYKAVKQRVPSAIGGKTREIVIRSEELSVAFAETELDQESVSALLNTEDDFAPLAGRLIGRIAEYSIQPPVWDPRLDIALYQSLKLGSPVVISWADAPANPYTGLRGWSQVIGRVLSRNRKLNGTNFGVDVTIELLAAIDIGRLAPAAVVTSKGSDANGAYFVVEDTNFVSDPDSDKDWWYFAVTDKLVHRDATGAAKAGWATRAVSGFGTNFVSDPTLANSSRVYVDGAIGSAVAAGDYITFSDWSAGNTVRMELYSAYATVGGALTGGDSAKRYE